MWFQFGANKRTEVNLDQFLVNFPTPKETPAAPSMVLLQKHCDVINGFSKIQTLKERVPFPSGYLDSKKQQASWKHHLVIWSSLTYTNHIQSPMGYLWISRPSQSPSFVQRTLLWKLYGTGPEVALKALIHSEGSSSGIHTTQVLGAANVLQPIPRVVPRKTHVQWPAEIQIIYVNTCHSLSLFEVRACRTQEQMRNWTIWVPT